MGAPLNAERLPAGLISTLDPPRFCNLSRERRRPAKIAKAEVGLTENDHCFLLQPEKRETAVKRLITFVTGALALILVAAAAGSAVTYAIMHGAETFTNLGNSALQGIGMAIGGCLASALVLRFKVARHYVRSLLKEINEKHLPV